MVKILKTRRSKIIAAVAVLAVAAGGTLLYIRAQNAKIPAVTLTAVTQGDLAKSVTITGNVETNNTNVISLSPTLKVVDVLVKEGQIVKKGDILAVLDTTDYQNQLKQQKINLANAEATLAYITGASSTADKTSTGNAESQAQIALDNANANYTAAQNNLNTTQTADNNAVSQAQIALNNANANYTAAQNNLDAIQTADDNAVSQAEIALSTANNNYTAAKNSLQNLEDQLQNANDALSNAKKAASNAQDAYTTAYNGYYIIPTTPPTTLQQLDDATTALASANATLASANAAQASEQSIYDSSSITAKQAVDNTDNAVKSAQVALDNAQAKADSDSTAAEKSISDADNAVQSAQVTLNNAQSKANSDSTSSKKAISDANNAVKSAQLALSNAKSTASFTLSTDSNKVTNQNAQIALLNATIENLNSKIEQGNLRANIDGTVTKMDAITNQFPAATDQIVVNGTYQFVVDIQASQYDSVNIMAGQKVNITVHGVSKKYEGTVSEIGQLAATSLTSTNTDPTVDIKISITNPDANVVVGYQADADVILAEKTDAVQVSFEAIQTDQSTGKKYVYVVDKSNKAKKTYIETGIETDYNVEVISGLTDGQKCISNPGTSIKDGTKVRVTGGSV